LLPSAPTATGPPEFLWRIRLDPPSLGVAVAQSGFQAPRMEKRCFIFGFMYCSAGPFVIASRQAASDPDYTPEWDEPDHGGRDDRPTSARQPDHSRPRDFGALRDFYRRVGWPQVMDDDEFAVFELRGILIAVFPLAKLARDGNTEPEPSRGGIRFTIGVQVDRVEEVDRLTEHMRAAGARVTKEPVDAEFFTGRSAYLCDPEGNYFEIVWADMPNNPVVIAARRAAGL